MLFYLVSMEAFLCSQGTSDFTLAFLCNVLVSFRCLWGHSHLRRPAFLVASFEIRAFPIRTRQVPKEVRQQLRESVPQTQVPKRRLRPASLRPPSEPRNLRDNRKYTSPWKELENPRLALPRPVLKRNGVLSVFRQGPSSKAQHGIWPPAPPVLSVIEPARTRTHRT